jgi:phage shock protein A
LLKTLSTLLRGAVADAEEAVFDANAIRVLEQQLRDAAASLEHSKRELACAIAHQSSEERAISALSERIADLEESGAKAVLAGREDLGMEAAVVIAATEDERNERRAALERYSAEVRRLRQFAEDGRKRLMDLRRGLELARAQESLRRAGANGRRALASGAGSLRQAEDTLVKIRELQARSDDVDAAYDLLDRQSREEDLSERLAAHGFGAKSKTDALDVMARLKARASSTPDTSTQQPKL